MSAAAKLLASTFKRMQTEPVEGVFVELADDSNLFEWKIWVEGPPDTPYAKGIFQMLMSFPPDFPMSPPELKVISTFYHPNVYPENGVVCISILHPPGEDEMSGESASERWLPTQTVPTILMSVISLFCDPNFSSPANVDAGVEWRNTPDKYKKRIDKLVEKATKEVPPHVLIPHPDTDPEEKAKQVAKLKATHEISEAMEDEMMYDSREPSDDEQEENSEEKSQSEEKSETNSKTKSSSSKKKNPFTEKKSGKAKRAMQEKQAKDSPAAKEEEPNLMEDTTSYRKKKKKCIIM